MQASTSKVAVWHIIIGGTIGNFTEWYNFLLFGYLASVISKLFFPSDDALLSLTLTFTLFALSFLVRPLGGILFGWIGDTYGRQRALVISLVFIAAPTFLIGCLPTYNTIGITSPILLCILRICQGLSAGGEHTGSAIYVAEYAPSNQRTLWVSTVPLSAALGILMSSIASLIIVNSFTETQLLSWGWRTGYWAGTLLCLISLALRLTLPETPYFKEMEEEVKHRFPLSYLIKTPATLKNLLLVFSLASCFGVFYQLLFIWMPTYLTTVNHYTYLTALLVNSIFMLFLACLIVIVGYWGDYINRKLLLSISCIGFFIFPYPLFLLLSSGTLINVYLAMGLFTILFSLFLPISFVCMLESFNTQIRYTGLSFGFNMGLAIFGGTCPLIATWLIEVTGNRIAPAFYLMLFSLIALPTIFFIQDKRGQCIG